MEVNQWLEISPIPILLSSVPFCAMNIVALNAYSVAFENIEINLKGKVHFILAIAQCCDIHPSCK
jgi:hypothetical protein